MDAAPRGSRAPWLAALILFLLIRLPAEAADEARIYARAWYPELFAQVPPRSALERDLRAVAEAALEGRIEAAEKLLAPMKSAPEADVRFLALTFERELKLQEGLLLGQVRPIRALSELMLRTMLHNVWLMEQMPVLEQLVQSLPRQRAHELADFLSFTAWLRTCGGVALSSTVLPQHVALCVSPPPFQGLLVQAEVRAVYLLSLGNLQYLQGDPQAAAASRAAGKALAQEKAWHCAMGTFEAHAGDLALGLLGVPPVFGLRLLDEMDRLQFPLTRRLPAGPGREDIALAEQAYARAAPLFERCGARGKVLASLRRAALEFARGTPQTSEAWLEVIRAAREAGSERLVTQGSAMHGLLTLTPGAIREAMESFGQRRDLGGVISTAEVGLDLALRRLATGDVGRATLTLETLVSGLEDSGLAQEAAPTLSLLEGELNRIYSEQGMLERAINTTDEALRQTGQYVQRLERELAAASPPARQILEMHLKSARLQELTLLQFAIFQFNDATALGVVLDDQATARVREYAAREKVLASTTEGGLSSQFEARSQRRRALISSVHNRLKGAVGNCAGWLRIQEDLGSELARVEPDGSRELLGLHVQLLGALALCDPRTYRDSALQLLQELRPIDKLKSAAASRPNGGRLPDVSSSQEAQLHLRLSLGLAMVLGELDVAESWLQAAGPLLDAAPRRTFTPAEEVVLRARLLLRRGRAAEARQLLLPWLAEPDVDYAELPRVLSVFIDASLPEAPDEALLAWERRQRLMSARTWGRVAVTPSHPGSAERASLENRLAKAGTLPKAERARLAALRKVPADSAAQGIRPATRERLRQLLGGIPKGSEVHVFHLTDMDEIASWVLRHGQLVQVHRKRIDRATFFDEVAELADALAAGATEWEEVAARLYPLFFGEAPQVASAGQLVIAASDELSRTFFEALNPEGQEPLALRFPVVRTDQLFDAPQKLAAALRRPPVIIGFNGPGLIHAEQEARDIARHLGPAATLLDGEKATRDAILRAVTGAELIHVATHGRIDPTNPVASSFQVAGEDALEAFALFEATRSARLVVFSACDTLASGFGALAHWGGTRWAITTPWSISDQRAITLMTPFYLHLLEASPSSALHAARRQVVKEGGSGTGHVLTDFLLSARSVEAAF